MDAGEAAMEIMPETKDRETRRWNDGMRHFVITSSNRWITIARVGNKNDVAEPAISFGPMAGSSFVY